MLPFAFYVNRDCQKDDCELHINFWYIEKKQYIDFGLMLNKDIKTIYIFMPFEIKKDDINFMNLSEDILALIFNTEVEISGASNHKHKIVKKVDDNQQFILPYINKDNYSIEKNGCNNVETKNSKFGILKLNIYCDEKGLSKYEKMYFRVRIACPPLQEIILFKKENNTFIQGILSSVNVIDFRISTERDVLGYNNELKADKKILKFSKVHFILLTSSLKRLNYYALNPDNCRLLESNVWKEYLPKEVLKLNKTTIAYHWKKKSVEKNNLESYSTLLSVQEDKLSIIGIFYIFSLGILASIVATIISLLFNIKNDYKSIIIAGIVLVFLLLPSIPYIKSK